MVKDLVYYAEKFGFDPNGIRLNILEQRKEIHSSFRRILVTSTWDMLDFGKRREGKSFVKRKVLISAAQTNREEGFRQRYSGDKLMGLVG